jgi:nitroreductase
MPFDLTQTDRLLTTTRSVRKRLDLSRPVARETVLECLDIALQAPTGGNGQRWRWLVVDDPELRSRIAEMYRRSWAPYIEARTKEFADAGVRQDSAIVDSATYLAEHLHEVPVHVIPCIEGRTDDKGAFVQASKWGSIMPATWSFMLAARSRGLGTVWTTFHLVHEREAAELLGIPYDDVMQAALIPVAYTLGTDFKPAVRAPPASMVHWDRW